MNYSQKYLKYKNKYLKLLSKQQIGGDKAFINNINSINLFTHHDMEAQVNLVTASGYTGRVRVITV